MATQIKVVYVNVEKIGRALTRRKERLNCDQIKKHMVVLRVGDWVCTEFGVPLGVFTGSTIMSHGYMTDLQMLEGSSFEQSKMQ